MESLIASVVLAIAVVGISGTLVATSQQAKDVDDSVVVNSLARELMEEIVAKPLAVSTTGNVTGWPGGNKDRTTYDNLSDFNGYTDTSPFKSIGGKSVDPRTGYSYTRTVSFEYRSSPSTALGSAASVTPSGGFLEALAGFFVSPAAVLSAVATSGSVAPAPLPTATEVASQFGFVTVKVTSSSGRYVMLNRLVCNTTYKK